VVIWG